MQLFVRIDLIGAQVYKTSFVTINNAQYVCNDTFVAVSVSETLVQLGKVVNIYFVNSTTVFFEVKMYNTVCFCRQYQAYQICEPEMAEGLVLLKPSSLVNHKAYFYIAVDHVDEDNLYIPICL